MEESKKPKKRGQVLYIVVLIILIVVFAVSAGMLIKYFVESARSQQTYSDIKNAVGDYTRPAPKPTTATEPDETTAPTEEGMGPMATVFNPRTGQQMQVLQQFAALYQQNPDLVGWISIPGTRIDYPVVQRPEAADYYLYRDFYGKHDSHGCIYAREVCDIFRPSDNITMYGHRMRDMTMFAELTKFQSLDFVKDNPYIYFDTLREYHSYKIVYVLTTSSSVGTGFAYHQYVDAVGQADFDAFIASCEKWKLFDTGETVQYGDKLITLSTCEYTHENGRLVVVAKRVE